MPIYGIGVDIQPVTKLGESIQRQGKEMLEHLFTAGELAYCQRKKTPLESLSARFAAKEAFFKALGTGWQSEIEWKDVEVVPAGDDRPQLSLSNEARRLADAAGVRAIHLSLSHCTDYALAEVILET